MDWLLDDYYDTRHRAYMMTEEGKVVIFFNCHCFVPLDMASGADAVSLFPGACLGFRPAGTTYFIQYLTCI